MIDGICNLSIRKYLDNIFLLIIMIVNNIRKAMTEKSKLIGSIQREGHWVEVPYVDLD